MKRIIAGMIGAAVLGGAAVAQEVTFYNRMGSVLVEQAAEKDADANFGKIYDRIVGQYDSEKFSFFGRFQADLVGKPNDGNLKDVSLTTPKDEPGRPWTDLVALDAPIIEFNGAMRPLPFLELALGISYGTETPWEGYELPGSYGYGSDVQYGRGYWADGQGGTILFKGAGIGVDGLYIGWNAVPVQDPFKVGAADGDGDGWDTQLGIIYNMDGLLGIGVGAKLSTRKWTKGEDRNANQQFGVYLEFTGVENLKVGAGVTMNTEDTNFTTGFIHQSRGDELDFALGDVKAAGLSIARNERGFVPFVNAGAEYSFAGMGLPLTLGADVGLVAGAQTLSINQNGKDTTVMPMLVGALVRFDPMENLWLDLRCVYEDAMLKGEGLDDVTISRLTITPRVHFLLSESDEFRLQVPIKTNWVPEVGKDGKRSSSTYTGFGIEIFWQHNF